MISPVSDLPAPTVHTLDNGLVVALEPLPYVRSVTVGVWIKTGSANEVPEHAGISHLLEHLFFKGTESRSARELMNSIECRGGQINAFTSREYTCLYVKMLDDHIETGIEILADILKNSTFQDLEKERNVILEEIATSIDVPEEYVHDLLTTNFWPDHALGRPVAGTMESVSSIGHGDVISYNKTWYRPENMIVSVVGRFDESALFGQLRDSFESVEKGPAGPRFDSPSFHGGNAFQEREIAQSHVALAFPGPSVTDSRRYTYDVLASTLGGGSTSRLFERIREDEGLAYSIYCYHYGYRETGMLGVYAAVNPENLHKTLALTFEEIRRLKEEPMPQEELESNREQLKGSLLIALESTSNRMGRLARTLMFFGRVLSIEEIVAGVDAVSAADVQALAQDIFTNGTCATAILGPRNGSAEPPAL